MQILLKKPVIRIDPDNPEKPRTIPDKGVALNMESCRWVSDHYRVAAGQNRGTHPFTPSMS
jgi:hypothetical protein